MVESVPLLPEPGPEVAVPLRSVIGRASGAGAALPSFVAVDLGGDDWAALAARFGACERARAVIVAARDQSLVTAARLGIGGALPLPPSTPAAIAALEAAGGSVAHGVDIGPVELLAARSEHVLAVRFQNHRFWRMQLGEPALTRRLLELADELASPPAMVCPAVLLLADRSADEVEEAWNRVAAASPGRPGEGVRCSSVEGADGAELAAAAVATLTGGDEPGPASPRPVVELPSGARVGSWATAIPDSSEALWCAVPELERGRVRWRLAGGDREVLVEEVTTVEEVRSHSVAVRFPGWLASTAAAGTPAGLLLTRLADAAARRGIPLWLPNVDRERLQLALRLGGTIWIDGPAVPEG